MAKKSIIERILGNAMTRVGTNVLTRVMTPVVNKALAPTAPATPLRNPQQSFFVSTHKGFLRRRRVPGGSITFEFVIDLREATPFRTFQQADNTAKSVVKTFNNNKCWFAVVQPTIGCGY